MDMKPVAERVAFVATVFLALAEGAPGQTPAGGEFRVNTYTTGDQVHARPAMEPDGDVVVVWDSTTQDGDDYMRRPA